jgi:hypothetical protein
MLTQEHVGLDSAISRIPSPYQRWVEIDRRQGESVQQSPDGWLMQYSG